jgi:hypothetical protein
MFAQKRSRRGSAIAELGPALFVFLIIIFFPLMDLVGAAADYAFAYILHNAEVRYLSVRVPDDSKKEEYAQAADRETIKALLGYAKFCDISLGDESKPAKIKHEVSYLKTDPVQVDVTNEINVVTQVNFRPFLRIPFLGDVPGLSSDLPFRISTTRPQEEKGRNG